MIAIDWVSTSPVDSISSVSFAFSASEPSHQWMASGWVSLATEATQSLRAASLLDIGGKAPGGAV